MAREFFTAYHSYLEAMEPLNDATAEDIPQTDTINDFFDK